MPYEYIEDLPSKIRKWLPAKAQKVFLDVWNSAYYELGYPEPVCYATAWKAVKNAGYEKNLKTGMWHKVR